MVARKERWLSETCYPDLLLDDMPLIYPFIINNPGDGAQAKRRTHAVIVDHLVPPMTSAGAYGVLAELAQMVDEYYRVEALDPGRSQNCNGRYGRKSLRPISMPI